jgi:hypothetical protein
MAVPCAAAFPAGGCTNQGAPADASADLTFVTPGGDSGAEDAESDGGPTLTSTMRLANMSPDLGQVDFCWRVTGSSTFVGPVIATSLDAGVDVSTPDAAVGEAGDASSSHPVDAAEEEASSDGDVEGSMEASAGIDALAGDDGGGDAAADAETGATAPSGVPVQVAFGQMTGFVSIPAIGTLDIALVSPNQLSCNDPAFIGRVTLDPGKNATVVVMGLSTPEAGPGSGLVMKSFTDEPADPATARVRLVHAALGWPGEDAPTPALAVTLAGQVTVDLAPTDTPVASTSPLVDALGYVVAPTFAGPAPVSLSTLGDAGTHTWTTDFFQLDLQPGASLSAFVVSQAGGALGLVWCDAQSVVVPGACVLELAR